jgi:polyisoprenoid-binding protein YceI
MRKIKFGILLSVGILFFNPVLFAATYKIDPQHTTVSFKIRHILTPVQGYFRKFEGTFDYDPEKPESWKTEATIDAASIDTNVEERDKHLRSADFFDVAQFSTITFKSTGLTDVTPASAKLNGLLSIHGVEKPVTLDLEIHGVVTDPWGNTIASFTGATKINRKDFGLNWNQALETGQVLVGEEVTIVLDVAGILQA